MVKAKQDKIEIIRFNPDKRRPYYYNSYEVRNGQDIKAKYDITYNLEGKIEDIISSLQTESEELEGAYIECDYINDYDGNEKSYMLCGWRKMTEKELIQYEKHKLADKEQRAKEKALQDQREIEQYEKLKAKFEKP